MSINSNAAMSYFKDHPAATLAEAAAALDLTEQEVFNILNTHIIDGDETKEVPAGQGGGFATVEVPLVEPTDIGYRWPDGSLHDEPYVYTET